MMNFNMAQSSSANLQEKPDSLTGVSPFWLKPSACAPNNWEDWLINFWMVCDLKERCATKLLLSDPAAVIIEPYPKPEQAPSDGSETQADRDARNNRNAMAIMKVDAQNSETRRKGPKIGHGAYYHEVDNSVKSRLFLAIGTEAQKRLKLKHPTLDITTESVKSLVEKLNSLFKAEKNVTYERMMLFSRSQKQGETMESFHNSLSHLAKTCELGNLEQSLVKDLFVAKMANKELQLKFCKERTSADDVLKEIILYERGTMESNTFQQISSKAPTTVPLKQEPTFAVGRQFGSRGRQAKRGGYQQKRDSGVSKRSKSDECRHCGHKPWSREHKEVCPAKGKECSLCKRTGHFASMCRAAKPKVGSIRTEEAD